MHDNLICPQAGLTAVRNNPIYYFKSRPRLSQGPGRHEPAITQPARTVYHRYLDISLHSIVLQTIITHDNIAAFINEHAHGLGPISGNRDQTLQATTHQHGLIAIKSRIAVRGHQRTRSTGSTSVSTRNDARGKPTPL